MTPDFLVPGFSKCGTTTLCALLAKHEDIFISDPKEPNFLSREDYKENWAWYETLFSSAKEGQLLGEGSTFYTTIHHEELARKNIKAACPDVKLIFIARDPIARIESAYREFHHSGPMFGLDCDYGLGNAMDQFPAMLEDSLYWKRIKPYLDDFPADNIKIVFLEDLYNNPREVIDDCLVFLKCDPAKLNGPLSEQLNSGSNKLYDTRLLRKIRNTPHIGPLFSKLNIPTQNRITRWTGLRRSFNKPIEWSTATTNRVINACREDTHQYLEFTGRDISIWPKFKQLLEKSIEEKI
jgi:hypothetical protein